MSKKCKAYSRSGLGLEPPDSRKAFYAGWDAALAEQPAQQEPVAWRWKECINGDFDDWVVTFSEPPPYAVEQHPLYTSPPQRQPLTDEQMEAAYYATDTYVDDGFANFQDGVRFAEAAHGIKGEA